MRRPVLLLLPVLLLAVPWSWTPALSAAPASSHWARWSAPAGSSHDFRGSVQLPANGFPDAGWTSTSRSPVQLPSGASTFLGPATAPGARYGSSRDQAYLNLRPYADNPTSPSVTTFDFAAPTPTAGWTFVLGDIDADQVHIEARDARGAAVPDGVIARWERGSFNYAGGTDRPVWHADTATLVGNAGAVDTNGAADWFEPDIALSSLTLIFTQRAGFPVFQVWLATLSHDVSGTVAGTAQCASSAATVRLLAPDGTELASTHPAVDGAYAFDGYAAQNGYRVAVEPPERPADSCLVEGTAAQSVDLTSADAHVDFALRDAVLREVTGTVASDGGEPVSGAVVTLTPPTGPERTTTTDDAGRYTIEDNPVADGYRISVTAPAGYARPMPSERIFDVTAAARVPEQDFTLTREAASTSSSPPATSSTPASASASASATTVTATHPGLASTTAGATATIAETGVGTGPLLLLAIASVAAGLALCAASRRRRGGIAGHR